MKEVKAQQDGTVSLSLADKRTMTASAVVVATEGPTALRLLGQALQAAPSKQENGVGTCCLYFRLVPCPGKWPCSKVQSGAAPLCRSPAGAPAVCARGQCSAICK